jgi:hypothetical protein
MDQLANVIEVLRAYPLLAAALAVAVAAAAFALLRKPRIQREADARLAALRRDKGDQYSKLRPPR